MLMVEYGDEINHEEIPVMRQWARRQKVHPLPPMGLGGRALNPNTAPQGIFMQARSLLVPLCTVVVAIVGFATTTAAMVMTVAAR